MAQLDWIGAFVFVSADRFVAQTSGQLWQQPNGSIDLMSTYIHEILLTRACYLRSILRVRDMNFYAFFLSMYHRMRRHTLAITKFKRLIDFRIKTNRINSKHGIYATLSLYLIHFHWFRKAHCEASFPVCVFYFCVKNSSLEALEWSFSNLRISHRMVIKVNERRRQSFKYLYMWYDSLIENVPFLYTYAYVWKSENTSCMHIFHKTQHIHSHMHHMYVFTHPRRAYTAHISSAYFHTPKKSEHTNFELESNQSWEWNFHLVYVL